MIGERTAFDSARRLISAFLLILMLAACGGQSSGDVQPQSEENEEVSDEAWVALATSQRLKMGASGVAGTYYSYGGVISEVLMSRIEGLSIEMIATQGSSADIRAISEGKIDIAIIQSDVCDYAVKGTALFTEKVGGFSAITGLYAEACHIIAKPGIESIDDLRGRNVSIGGAGSSTEFNALQIMEIYGMTKEDIRAHNLEFGDSADAFTENQLDAIFCVAAVPNAAIDKLAEMSDVVLLEIDDAHADALIAKYPAYAKTVISGGDYRGSGFARTVALKAVLVVSNDLSEEVVYTITKGLFMFSDEIAAAHPKGGYLNSDFAVEGVPIPFHPGATRYYEELEMASDDHE